MNSMELLPSSSTSCADRRLQSRRHQVMLATRPIEVFVCPAPGIAWVLCPLLPGTPQDVTFASRLWDWIPLWCGHVSERLMSSSLVFSRPVLVAGLLLLSLSACGRRGALEPPPDPSAAQEAVATAPEGTLPSPVGTPHRSNTNRPFTVPNKPFILDPLL
jgi:predicted small lipoprotein YifL